MLRLTFTEEEIDALHYERYLHPHPRVQQKMEALYLKSQKYAHKEITQLLSVYSFENKKSVPVRV
ncbi:MAG TPA: hypothetical protein DCZ88_00690, partial [Pseudanabaena sp.]|nr:hypothetical protein [Pseudanabaena sp.]